MPAVKNPKHEMFARELALGKSATEAYANAGFKPDRANAGRLQHADHIQKRVVELRAARAKAEDRAVERAIERTAITKQRIMEELAKIGFANMADYTRLVGYERVPDLSEATRDQMAAVQEITVEDFKDGRGEGARDVRRVRFKLYDKKGALVDIGKEIGMFIDRKEHTIRVEEQLAQMSAEERATWAARLAARARSLLEAPTIDHDDC